MPFAVPVGFHQARDLALALATRTPSMDPSPNQTLSNGLIRPPGSVHSSGGHQVLHGSLAAAHQLTAAGNPPAVLRRLLKLLAVRTGNGPQVMATLRSTTISLLRLAGHTKIATALRHHGRSTSRPIGLLLNP